MKALEYLPDELHFVLVGRPTAYIPQLKEFMTKAGLQDRVHFLHGIPSDDLPAIYQSAETFVVIADNDGKVLEISKTCSISRAIGESIGIEKMSAAYTEALFRELEVMITKEGLDNIFYERAFERLIPQGHSFYALDTTEYFSVELDTVNDFEQAQRLIPSQLY